MSVKKSICSSFQVLCSRQTKLYDKIIVMKRIFMYFIPSHSQTTFSHDQGYLTPKFSQPNPDTTYNTAVYFSIPLIRASLIYTQPYSATGWSYGDARDTILSLFGRSDSVPAVAGEMNLKLWLIVANFQMHWATFPPKGSVFIAQSGRLRYTSSDRNNSTHFWKIKEKKRNIY